MNLSDLGGIAWQPWLPEALCSQTDPEIFFPEKGEPGRTAREICFKCPVIHDCLQWAIDNREMHGIWGGLSPVDRKIMGNAKSPTQVPPAHETWHGTKAGARRHYREGTRICVDCRTAYNDHERSYRRYTRTNRKNQSRDND